ncbi:hypothetical protein ACKEMH_004767, partial [Enterobacter hormaechei]
NGSEVSRLSVAIHNIEPLMFVFMVNWLNSFQLNTGHWSNPFRAKIALRGIKRSKTVSSRVD